MRNQRKRRHRLDWVDVQIFATLGMLTIVFTAISGLMVDRTTLDQLISFVIFNVVFSFIEAYSLYDVKKHYAGVAWLVLDATTVFLTGIMYLGSLVTWPETLA